LERGLPANQAPRSARSTALSFIASKLGSYRSVPRANGIPTDKKPDLLTQVGFFVIQP
jgi:hypothetical protein